MENKISKIPPGLSPACPVLSTLILSDNPLSEIPGSFFEKMCGLKVLDLSRTDIAALPDSISRLENLLALRLGMCQRLKFLPSLVKLKALKKLDLNGAGIQEVPQDMMELISLEYLDLFCQHLKGFPIGMLPNLSSLQYLVVYFWKSNAVKIKGEEVAELSNLETLKGRFGAIHDLNYFVDSQDFQSLTGYMLVVGPDNEDIISQNIALGSKCVLLISHCDIETECILLPDNLQNLQIHRCKNMRSLNKTAFLGKATQLRWCSIWDCEEIESVFDLVSSSYSWGFPALDKLEFLYLYLLPRLDVLVRVEGVPTLLHIFSNLKMLLVSKCSGMRKLFPLELLQTLQNLEEIRVGECEQMEEIIASSSDSNAQSDKFTFPKLRELKLFKLPQLESICSARGVLVCDSIEVIEILNCPKLNRIPLQLALLDNGKLSPPPHLRKIYIEKDSNEWWESLEWNDPEAKDTLQSFLQYND